MSIRSAAVFAALLCASFTYAQNSSPYWSLAGNSNAVTESKLGTTNDVDLRLYTNNISRILIKASNGNVIIGAGFPSSRFNVNGNARFTDRVVVEGGGLQSTHYSGDALYGISGSGRGVRGTSTNHDGVYGFSSASNGVYGRSTNSNAGYFYSTNGTGLRASTQNGTYAARFYGNVWTTGSYLTSDKNLKQNIREFSDAISIIERLKPRYYQFKNDPKYAFLHLPKGSHYGLLAQDVEAVLPGLVTTDEHEALSPDTTESAVPRQKPEAISLKAVNYTELISIMVKAIQEQQAVIEEQNNRMVQQDQRIEELATQLNKLLKNQYAATDTRTGTLGQNTPNPANGSTRITYSIHPSRKAQLLLTDAGGKRITSIVLNSSGVVDVDTTTLSSGLYNYSLVVDGKLVETKKLTVVR